MRVLLKMPVPLLMALTCCVLSAQTRAVDAVTPACPTMEIGIGSSNPRDSIRSLRSDRGKLVSVVEKPLLTIDDFTSANVSQAEDQIVLNVGMTADGAKRLQTFTSNHTEEQIALVVNGRVINTPTIRDPITGNGFLIGPFHRDEAKKLANSINHKESGCGLLRKNFH